MQRRTVLVVDDSDRTRGQLVDGLRAEHDVTGVASGEEAVDLVDADPTAYEFVVLDHRLGGGLNGIATAESISALSEAVFILLFSNIPAQSELELERTKDLAYRAGAHRYIARADAEVEVARFIDEMGQLSRLQDRVEEIYERRRDVPSLVAQLDLGIDIVDRDYKLWFMNGTMRRITGVQGSRLPRARCAHWHGFSMCPCPGCLVAQTFQDGHTHDRRFLSPLVFRDDQLHYLHVWTQAVTDDAGGMLLASDGRPLAVMETVQELSGPDQRRLIPHDERLAIIAHAVAECRRGAEDRGTPFKRVEVYAADAPGGNMVLKACGGTERCSGRALGVPFEQRSIGEYDTVLDRARSARIGSYSVRGVLDPDTGRYTPCIHWPVLNEAGLVAGWIVARGRSMSGDDVRLVRPYADEVARALADHAGAEELAVTAKMGRALLQVDNSIRDLRSPEQVLQGLIVAACHATDSYLGHVRERRGPSAVLVPLGPHPYDGYERSARQAWPLTHRESWSARTILSGAGKTENRLVDWHERMPSAASALSDNARAALAGARSCCFVPLMFDSRCIGTLGFHALQVDHYTAERVWFLHQIARRAALALHDLVAKREAEETEQALKADVVMLLLHNINQPLGALRSDLRNMASIAESIPTISADVDRVLKRMSAACDRISRTREDFHQFLQPVQARWVPCDVGELVGRTARSVMALHGGADLCLQCDFGAPVVTYEAAIKASVEVLVQNSLDEFARIGRDRGNTVHVEVRPATEDESGQVLQDSPCFALIVQDNGEGIASSSVASLFTITRSHKARGLGIGLAQCRRMVRAAGGDVLYQATDGGGARFVVVMPYKLNA